MNKPDEHSDPMVQSEQEPRRLHLPGFTAGEEIGLGDVIKRATSHVGIKPAERVSGGPPRCTAVWSSRAGAGNFGVTD
ncbi:MAG: hypothetical protein LC130_20130 [Bryobacterales bacterium]|nr:hypothetical protein [Bryobacterales bacterium]MEB2361456.1 hypothetical protein [Bryobacterales bacterium]